MSGKISSIMEARFFAITVLLAFLGVIGLYFYAMSIGPSDVSIAEIGEDDVGLIVSTQGIVKDVKMNRALIITMIDVEDSASIMVYVPLDAFEPLQFKSDLLPGAELGVMGEVSEFNGDLEIVVRTHRDLTLISKPSEVHIQMDILAKNPDLFRDMNLSVEGIVASIGQTVYLDGDGAINLVLKSGNHELSCIAREIDIENKVTLGSSIVFRGTFQYREETLTWVLVDGNLEL
jgi:DNA/RNA endonuclease YhcR with UshA esterase domain